MSLLGLPRHNVRRLAPRSDLPSNFLFPPDREEPEGVPSPSPPSRTAMKLAPTPPEVTFEGRSERPHPLLGPRSANRVVAPHRGSPPPSALPFAAPLFCSGKATFFSPPDSRIGRSSWFFTDTLGATLTRAAQDSTAKDIFPRIRFDRRAYSKAASSVDAHTPFSLCRRLSTFLRSKRLLTSPFVHPALMPGPFADDRYPRPRLPIRQNCFSPIDFLPLIDGRFSRLGKPPRQPNFPF